MSQDAGAGQSKRSQTPAYVYGPMVYQFPAEAEAPKEKSEPQSDKPGNYPVVILMVLLALGAVALYLREDRVELGQLNLRRSFTDGSFAGEQMLGSASYDNRKSFNATQARVAADRLYLREGPGMIYVATYLLPKNWGVSLVGDYEMDDYGEVWEKVLVHTDEGLQKGWVSRKYLEYLE